MIGTKKVWSLSYADDLVLLAKDANEMKKILKTLARFLKERDLNLSTKRSKMMTFRRGRREKEYWIGTKRR